MLRILNMLVVAVSAVLVTAIAQAQTRSSSVSGQRETSADALENWLTGMWDVTSAKVIENGESRDPEYGHQDVLLFTDGMKVEIYLPDPDKHKAMAAVGSKIKFASADQEGVHYVGSEFVSNGSNRNGRFTVAATNIEQTAAQITFFHRRANAKNWKYQLEISKILDTNQLKEIATNMLPFLTNTADISVFGQRGLADGYTKTEKVYCDLMENWANKVLHGSSGSTSTMNNQPTSGTP